MSNSYTIEELITGYYDEAFSEVIDDPMPKLSLKHRINMKRIFRKFAQNKEQVYVNGVVSNSNTVSHKPLTFRQRLVIVMIIILCCALAVGFVVLYGSNGFQGTVYPDNTRLFAINSENCPDYIEREYVLSVIPKGYKVDYKTVSSNNVYTVYKNNSGETLIFQQNVKNRFDNHINTEGYAFQETSINGCNAVVVEYKRESEVNSLVIWDNKNYILELIGNFTKDKIVDLANSNEICGF